MNSFPPSSVFPSSLFSPLQTSFPLPLSPCSLNQHRKSFCQPIRGTAAEWQSFSVQWEWIKAGKVPPLRGDNSTGKSQRFLKRQQPVASVQQWTECYSLMKRVSTEFYSYLHGKLNLDWKDADCQENESTSIREEGQWESDAVSSDLMKCNLAENENTPVKYKWMYWTRCRVW